jgi:uncharacterized protein (DUF1778 family)
MTEAKERTDTVRLSITIDPEIRKIVRIAAAYADLEVGEWAGKVLREAAEKAIGADRGLGPGHRG